MQEHGTPQLWVEFEEDVNVYDIDNAYLQAMESQMEGKGFWHWFFSLHGLEKCLPAEMPNTAMARMTQSAWFTSCQALLIFANTIFMGMEADLQVKACLEYPPSTPPEWLTTSNTVFNIIFAVELMIRMVALRGWFWCARHEWAWNYFDTFLVAVSLVSDWLLNRLLSGINVSFLRTLRVARTIRVARVIRVLRFFRELRQMLYAIMACLWSLAWAFVFLVMVMFMCSILFLQGVANTLDDMEWNTERQRLMHDHVQMWFGSLGDAMLSLLAAVTGGQDWLEIKKPLDEVGVMYGAAFIVYLLFITVGVMNVLTGVFLSNSDDFFDLDLIGQRESVRVEGFIGQMLEFFGHLDLKHLGEIDWQTFRQQLQKHPNLRAYLASMKLEPTHLRLIFDLLDEKRTGKIDMVDFVMQMVKLKGEAKAIDARIIQREIGMIPMLLHHIVANGQIS